MQTPRLDSRSPITATTTSPSGARPLLGYYVLEKDSCEPLDLRNIPQMGCLHDYLFAANGVFRRAERREFSAIVFYSSFNWCIPGLESLDPQFTLNVPKVPRHLIQSIITLAQTPQPFVETLYWLTWNPHRGLGEWELFAPPQESSTGEVRPIETEESVQRFQGASIEIHTHPPGCEHFSLQDGMQAKGFRVYGLLLLEPSPHFRFRVGMDELFWEIDPKTVIELWE